MQQKLHEILLSKIQNMVENIIGGEIMSLQIVTNYANAITLACGLSLNQAKTVIYWVVVTYGIEKLELMPILTITGPQGTGKSTLMKLTGQICYRPRQMDGEMSKAELRDKLEINTTALLEEADNVDERLLLKRFSRQTATTSIKDGSASQGWKSKPVHFFGSTCVHRRISFKDAALDSRSIAIRTAYKQGTYTVPVLDPAPLSAIAAGIDWSQRVPAVAGLDGRAVDAWMPLCQVAVACNDVEFMAYVIGQINEAIKNLKEGQAQEPVQLVVSKLIALAWDDHDKLFKDRVALKAIEKGLKEDGSRINSWQAGKALREQGFGVRTIGGTQYAEVTKPQLKNVAEKLGIDDDLLK